MAKKKEEMPAEDLAPKPVDRMVRAGQVRVRAKVHLGAEDEQGRQIHRSPGEEFSMSADLCRAWGPTLVEEVAEEAKKPETP